MFFVILTIVSLYFIAQTIILPIQRIKIYVAELVKGILPKKIELKSKDEISEMVDLIDEFVSNLKDKANLQAK